MTGVQSLFPHRTLLVAPAIFEVASVSGKLFAEMKSENDFINYQASIQIAHG